MRNVISWTLLPLLGLFSVIVVGQSADQAEPIKITKGPTVESTTGTQATIAWSTNVSSGTVVKYGTSPDDLNQKAQTPWGGLTHRVVIKNLQPDTNYFFTVDSSHAEGTGGSATSDLQQFQTKPANYSATDKPSVPLRHVAAGPVIQVLTTDSATLWWLSDQTAPAEVSYGLSQASLDKKLSDTPYGNEHVVELSGLEPGKTYYYSVSRPTGGIAASGQFTTPQQSPDANVKITNGPVIEYVGHNHAIIAWSTSAPASSIVRYGTDPNDMSHTAQAPWGSTTHRVDIKNLQPNTRYYFAVISTQAQGSGTMAQSAAGQLHTMGQGQQALALSPR